MSPFSSSCHFRRQGIPSIGDLEIARRRHGQADEALPGQRARDGLAEGVARRHARRRLGEVKQDIRFNVPCERLSNKTAHAILRILRELATTASSASG